MATTDDGLDESAHPASADKRHRLARWLKGSGIEVGALHHPLAVPADARVTYVDRMTESELRRHYPELEAEAFAPVTVIGNAEDLSAFADGSLDFVVAAFAPPESREDNEFILILLKGRIREVRLPPAGNAAAGAAALDRWQHLRARIRQSPAGPILRPVYRFLRHGWQSRRPRATR